MKELQDIVNAFNLATGLSKKTALATVVFVEGSSYRRAGARMLITEDGQLTGAISGGCLEGDALRKARMAILQQKPMLVTYDTNDDDDAKLGVQLGCNGIINILIEPIDPSVTDNAIALFIRFFAKREPVVIITVFNLSNPHEPQPGTCLLMDVSGLTTGKAPHEIENDLTDEAFKALHGRHTYIRTYISRNQFTCFIELLQPTIKLIVVGAGNDAIPLVQIAKVLGWEVNLIDGRPNYITAERFPMADKLIVARPEEVVSKVKADYRTVVMLMTHNFNYDSKLLAHLLPLNLPYIGVLGPKKRLNKIFEEIPGGGMAYSNVHGPAGLDIGSETPEQIALSITAEIQGVLNKLSGVPLNQKNYIHDRSNEHVING